MSFSGNKRTLADLYESDEEITYYDGVTGEEYPLPIADDYDPRETKYRRLLDYTERIENENRLMHATIEVVEQRMDQINLIVEENRFYKGVIRRLVNEVKKERENTKKANALLSITRDLI